jgi:hypothetical protein
VDFAFHARSRPKNTIGLSLAPRVTRPAAKNEPSKELFPGHGAGDILLKIQLKFSVLTGRIGKIVTKLGRSTRRQTGVSKMKL